jgi:catechol 2,3-dioxygenase-like lactoylglutathione lyase family enzyme
MFEFPKAKLGDVTAVTITSPDLEKSFNYYQRLGFTELFRTDFPFPLIQITDGAILIMLRKDKNPYIALTYYTMGIDNVVEGLKQDGIEPKFMPTPDPNLKRFLISTPEGHNITLVTHLGFDKPNGSTMLTMQPQDYSNPEKYTNKVCGMFGELAYPVKSLEDSILFWEKLGFKTLLKRMAPYPWAILSDGLAIAGLHETNTFSAPTITFFASDMKDKIEKLKQAGLNNFSENGQSNNVLTTPEQQKINLFKLGM